MARIAGVDLPREKRVQVGLTYVYGIGQTTANKILEATGINPDPRVKDRTLEEDPVLPWHPPSQESALPRPAHQDQCTYLQGSQAHCR